MKILNILICGLMVTGIVACSKKKGGGNPQVARYQQPYPNGQYPHGQPGYPNDLGPNGPQQPQIFDFPGCVSAPPMITGDLYRDCHTLATLTDCNREAVDQAFIKQCYGLNLNRPGCVFTIPTIVETNCGVNCYEENYESSSSDRVYEEETVVRREYIAPTTSPVIRSDRVSEIREPVRSGEGVRVVERHSTPDPARPRIVVEDNSTSRDNTVGVPASCIAESWKDCKYRRSVGRKGATNRNVTWGDVSSHDRNNKSFFDRQIEAGNVRCQKNGLRNLDYVDYLKEVERNCFGETVVAEQPVTQEAQTFPVAQVPAEAAPQLEVQNVFDSSKCQWIVSLHNQLAGGKQGWASFSRQYTIEPFSNVSAVSNQDLGKGMCVVGHGGNRTVLVNAIDANDSAIGVGVSIQDDILMVGNSQEIIKSCEPTKIVTQFTSGNHFVTRTYTWNGSAAADGQIDIRTLSNLNRYNTTATKMDFITSRIVIWKKDVTQAKVRAEFELDSRVTSRQNSRGDNTMNLSNRTNNVSCEGIARIE